MIVFFFFFFFFFFPVCVFGPVCVCMGDAWGLGIGFRFTRHRDYESLYTATLVN